MAKNQSDVENLVKNCLNMFSACVDKNQSRFGQVKLFLFSVVSVNFQMVSVLQLIELQRQISCNL